MFLDLDEFYQQCDPERENLCLYGKENLNSMMSFNETGDRDGSWSVDLPSEEVPPELPEPCLGINFARDGMQKRSQTNRFSSLRLAFGIQRLVSSRCCAL